MDERATQGAPMAAEGILTIEEAAKELRIGRTLAFRIVSQGELNSFTVGRRRLIDRRDLLAYIERRKSGKVKNSDVDGSE